MCVCVCVCVCVCRGERSRVDLHGQYGEDGVLVAAAHHHPERGVLLDGGADVGRRGDPLSVDGDDDVVLFESSAGTGTQQTTGSRSNPDDSYPVPC